MRTVDLFVIGAGSGGVRAARIAANHGARVIVAEEYRVGGTCVIRGCVPKKLLVYASRFADAFADAKGFGWTLDARPSFDWASLIAAKDTEIDRLEGAYGATLAGAKVEVIRDRAVLETAKTVRLAGSGEVVRAETILVATGGTPVRAAGFPGAELCITSDEAFDLPALPRRVAVVGGGYIALEFATIFSGLGAAATVVYRGPEILRGFDDEVRAHLREEMAARGVEFRLNATIERLEKTPDGLRCTFAGGDVAMFDAVMLAIGRAPATAGLGLEKAGVALGRQGEILVDDMSRTSVDNIYAVGDVTDRVPLTPVAIREGHAFADTVFGGRPTKVDHATIATAVFAEPETAWVGLSEQQARAGHRVVDIYRARFRPMKATLSGRQTRTLMKIVVDGETDRVLGLGMVGADAGEIVQMAAVALTLGARKADLDATMALHPSAAEEFLTMRTRAERHVRD